MRDAGIVTLCTLENTAAEGNMPKPQLKPLTLDDEVLTWQFEERTVGLNRQYLAKGVSERVDLLIRIERAPARIGMYAVLTDYEGQINPEGDQYRIDNVQHPLDGNGLKVTDLTLYRLEELYDVDK